MDEKIPPRKEKKNFSLPIRPYRSTYSCVFFDNINAKASQFDRFVCAYPYEFKKSTLESMANAATIGHSVIFISIFYLSSLLLSTPVLPFTILVFSDLFRIPFFAPSTSENIPLPYPSSLSLPPPSFLPIQNVALFFYSFFHPLAS